MCRFLECSQQCPKRHFFFFLPLKQSKQGDKKDWNCYLKTKSQSDKETYEKHSKLLEKKKILEFDDKQVMTEAGNRNCNIFQFADEVVKIWV